MEISNSTRTKLQTLSAPAVSTVAETMTADNSNSLRLKAALEVLKLTGFDPAIKEAFAEGVGKTSAKEIQKENDMDNKFKKLQGDLM